MTVTFIPGDYHPTGVRSVLDGRGGTVDVPITPLAGLKPGMSGTGPVLIEDDYLTCRVTEGWRFQVTANYDICMSRV